MQGVGIPSLVMYFMWALVTIFGFLPLLLYSDLLGDPFDPDSAKEDCKVSFWDARTVDDSNVKREPGWHAEASLEGANCDTRYILYIVAVVLSGLAVLIVFVFLLFTTLRAMSQTRSQQQAAPADNEELQAARDSAKKVQLTNKGQFVSNAPADPAAVVVKGFGVNGAPPAAQRRTAPRLFHGVGAMGGVAGFGRAGAKNTWILRRRSMLIPASRRFDTHPRAKTCLCVTTASVDTLSYDAGGSRHVDLVQKRSS